MAWDKTKPAGSQKIRLSDEEIRANWAAIDAVIGDELDAGDPLLLDEDDMASDSDTQAPTQQSVKAFVESGTVTFSNKDFEQDGGMTITDTGATTDETPHDVLVPNLDDVGDMSVRLGAATSTNNSAQIGFHNVTTDDAGNYAEYSLAGVTGIRVDGSGNVGVGKTSGGAKLDVDGEVEATALDINGNADVSGTFGIGGVDFTATPAEINSRCDGVPSQTNNYSSAASGDWIDGESLVYIDLGTVTTGDVFYMSAQANVAVSSAAGLAAISCRKLSGTATIGGIETPGNYVALNSVYLPSGWNSYINVGGMFVVTGSGTLVMQAYGYLSGVGSAATSISNAASVTWLKKQ
jgi:hypothetical protein